jgi:hypothetical protein
MDWPRILAYITGTVDQGVLLRNEYLVAENRILREQVNGRLLLSDSEKKALAQIGYRLDRKALEDVANAAKPDYDPRLVQEAGGQEIRWFDGTSKDWQTSGRRRRRAANGAHGEGESQLGL